MEMLCFEISYVPERSIYLAFFVTECPEGFVSGIYQFQCYLIVEGDYSWYNASSICESQNAYVAELIDPEERDAVWRYAKSKKNQGVQV